MLRDTANNESIIVEYGFIDNSGDASKIKDNYEKYAEVVVKAVCEYKGIKYIPNSNVDSDEYYVVVKGDTLWGIAKKFNTTIDKIKNDNKLTTNVLQIGQKLKILENNIPENNDIGTNYYEYKVIKGDNLYSIANKYGTSVKEIKNLNNLSSDTIKINQILKIPVIKYKVVKGDNLTKIAKKYNTTVSKIKTINNLNTDTLQINQELLLPDK